MAQHQNDISPDGQDGFLKGWSNSGKIFPGGGLNGRSRAVKLQCDLDEEGPCTVQFGIKGSTDANIRAIILGSVKGNTVRRVITVVDGATITVRGKNVAVEVRDFSSEGSGLPAYTVSVLATVGLRPTIKQPPVLSPLTFGTNIPDAPFTTPIGPGDITVGPSAFAFVEIPEDAGVNSVQITAIQQSATPIPLGLARIAHINNFGEIKVYDPRDYPDFVPLSPNTEFIQLGNADPAESIIYNVTFGIDG